MQRVLGVQENVNLDRMFPDIQSAVLPFGAAFYRNTNSYRRRCWRHVGVARQPPHWLNNINHLQTHLTTYLNESNEVKKNVKAFCSCCYGIRDEIQFTVPNKRKTYNHSFLLNSSPFSASCSFTFHPLSICHFFLASAPHARPCFPSFLSRHYVLPLWCLTPAQAHLLKLGWDDWRSCSLHLATLVIPWETFYVLGIKSVPPPASHRPTPPPDFSPYAAPLVFFWAHLSAPHPHISFIPSSAETSAPTLSFPTSGHACPPSTSTSRGGHRDT